MIPTHTDIWSLEFHVLRAVKFCEQLGCCQRTDRNYVYFWGNIGIAVLASDSDVHIWQTHAELVGKARPVREVEDADNRTSIGDGLMNHEASC